MKTYKITVCLVTLIITSVFFTTASAMRGPGMKRKGGNIARQTAPLAEPSGLEPAFPDQARCVKIASPFGSATRYDGSQRPRWAPGGGTHGGIDLTLQEGTPIVAIAAGTVVKKGQGGMMEGIYIWLKHAPKDTGLSYWVYSKYQHLASPSDLNPGARVSVGQVIAHSGKTGTVGGHYGGDGYPHLHLTTRKSIDGAFEGAQLVDPLEIYRDANPAAVQNKSVKIPYIGEDGQRWPEDTRLVWPVACGLK